MVIFKKLKGNIDKSPLFRYVRFILLPSIFSSKEKIKRNKRYHKYNLAALYAFQEAMESINKTFWLDWGTLLGAIREKDFIVHDNDLDFGMYLSDFSDEIEISLISKGFKKLKKFEKDKGETALEYTYSLRGVQVDIFFYSKKEEHMICHHFGDFGEPKIKGSIKEGECTTFENYCPSFELTNTEFKGRNFLIPKNTTEYLTNYYGKDYMIPVIETEYIPDRYSYTKPIGVGKYYFY